MSNESKVQEQSELQRILENFSEVNRLTADVISAIENRSHTLHTPQEEKGIKKAEGERLNPVTIVEKLREEYLKAERNYSVLLDVNNHLEKVI